MKSIRKKNPVELINEYASRIRLEERVVKEFVSAYLVIANLRRFNIKHVFVENYTNERGGQTYANFCFFGDGFYAEASNPKEVANEEQRDLFVVSLKEGLAKVNITNYSDFDFRRANDKSQVTIAFNLRNGESFFLNATGINCDVLLEIYHGFLMPLF